MNALVFSGQGSQKQGMGKDLYDNFDLAKILFEEANEILGRKITDIMFYGNELELSRTINAQPAIFLYQVILYQVQNFIKADIVCGHSLGEYAALVICNSLSFKDGLELVNHRSIISQNICDNSESSMAAVIGFDDSHMLNLIDKFFLHTGENIYIANYNGPGQIVISGSKNGVKEACSFFKQEGAKRAVVLPISGGFHSPFVINAEVQLANIIEKYHIFAPSIPIIQSSNSNLNKDPFLIKNNLKNHLTSSVNFTKMVHELVKSGVKQFYEVGTDDTLQKIIKRMYPELEVDTILNIPKYKNTLINYSIF
jgi:[acyl-carrier-protein] S-malonyltransferase